MNWRRFIAPLAAGVLALTVSAQPADTAAPDEVVLQPGKMGMVVETLSPKQASQAGDASLKGARITQVTPGSPAEKLGLRSGDIIVQANGRPVVSHSEVAALMRDRLVGAATRLQVRRGNDQRLLDLLVPAAPQPMLRIEAGMHNAPIRKLALDAAGRWLVTASEDKTAKVWDLKTGRLALTLRPPVGDDNEGKLAAVAMSPDGARVAVAGWTGMWGKTASAYVFDRSSAKLLRQLSGLPGKIEALAWSPDGQFLALAFAVGVQVYRTDRWSALPVDASDAGPSAGLLVGLDFDRRNRLVSAGHDGQLRLYAIGQDGVKLLARRAAPGGKQIQTARFSPDGSLIAVGYADSTQVSILSSGTLELSYAADTQSVRNGDLRNVAWSADGRTLFAAGRYVSGSRQAIRSWSDAGRGQPRDVPVAENSILDLQALPGGGVVYGTAEPAWGVLSAPGTKTLGAASPIADYRGAGQQLQVSRDGHKVRFAFERNGPLAADFDAAVGVTATESASADVKVSPAMTEFSGMVVSQWKNTAAPQLNALPLSLRAGENSRSLAIAPDGSNLVLGSDWGWNKFDASGKLLGRTLTPGATWAINYSGDGRYVIAAFADGTVRWFNAGNGHERLALFAHSDRKRWVAWTPSGFYAASAGGEELVGWHINNGPDQAGDFYPASRFRARFYRPDVIAKVLESGTDLDALRLANQESGRASTYVDIAQALPPMIDPVSPAEARVSESAATLRFKLRNVGDAPLQTLRVRVNGGNAMDVQSAALQRGGSGDELSLNLALPEQDSTVELFAQNRNGVSTPAIFKFYWQGTPPKKSRLPTLHLLAIGVSDYHDDSMSLEFPAKDATDFVNALKAQKDKLYGEVQVVTLTNAQATRQAVLDNLALMKSRVKSNDVGILFIAGHGVNAKDGTYYFVPYDFDRKKLDSAAIASTGVSYTAIRSTLAEIPGRAMLFIDTCHAGNVMGKSDLTGAINDLTARENSVVVFASSTQKEPSQEDAAWNNGAFTKALVMGLQGGGDLDHDGKVMYTGLQYYLSRTVTKLTGNTQHPVVLPGGIEDFVVSIP